MYISKSESTLLKLFLELPTIKKAFVDFTFNAAGRVESSSSLFNKLDIHVS